MATQMQLARKGIITEAMKQVAAYEGVTEEFIRKGVAEGTINSARRGAGAER